LIYNVGLLWEAIHATKHRKPFDLIAWVMLPDHLHLLIDPADQNVSDLLKSNKLSFARKFSLWHETSGVTWQRGFWDHVIRDETDLRRHVDYIHLNPVKHGLVDKPFDYPHSSIMKFKDYYSDDWGTKGEEKFEGEFGE